MIAAACAGYAKRACRAIAGIVILASVATAALGQMAPVPGTPPALPRNLPEAGSDAQTKTEVAVVPAKSQLTTCAVVTVRPGLVRADGHPWDTIATEPPDIRIAESTTGTFGECDDTWSCSITLTPKVGMLELTLTDTDSIGGDDPMGAGKCAIGRTCDFGAAEVTVGTC